MLYNGVQHAREWIAAEVNRRLFEYVVTHKRDRSTPIPGLLKSRELVSVVPDARKAEAVRQCLQGPVTPEHPASILQTHPNVTVYLDRDSAARLA